jgi:hypothetical protein
MHTKNEKNTTFEMSENFFTYSVKYENLQTVPVMKTLSLSP